MFSFILLWEKVNNYFAVVILQLKNQLKTIPGHKE
jgi:hypothetical protein